MLQEKVAEIRESINRDTSNKEQRQQGDYLDVQRHFIVLLSKSHINIDFYSVNIALPLT